MWYITGSLVLPFLITLVEVGLDMAVDCNETQDMGGSSRSSQFQRCTQVQLHVFSHLLRYPS